LLDGTQRLSKKDAFIDENSITVHETLTGQWLLRRDISIFTSPPSPSVLLFKGLSLDKLPNPDHSDLIRFIRLDHRPSDVRLQLIG
jgi:hypothetical protein